MKILDGCTINTNVLNFIFFLFTSSNGHYYYCIDLRQLSLKKTYFNYIV